jgi:hypothetical protein
MSTKTSAVRARGDCNTGIDAAKYVIDLSEDNIALGVYFDF